MVDQTKGLGTVLLLAVVTTTLGVLLGSLVPVPRPGSPRGPVRVISLTPSMTDTLFAIGAGDSVVGVSDYCQPPKRLSRVGSGITPNYDRIARLEPTLVVGEPSSGVRPELVALADARWLPWFTLEEVVSSTRQLGGLTGHANEARALAEQLEYQLGRPPPPDAPRVLLVLGTGFGNVDQYWFARHGCLHDRVLGAAGGFNAVPRELPGPPSLSLEQVVEIDPDVVILLSEHTERGAAEPMVATLRGAIRGRVVLVAGADVLSTGPRILNLVVTLRRELERLKAGA